MALTKEQFEQAALNAMSQFPALAAAVSTRDPRIMAQIRAQATMLAMLSEQVEVAEAEWFVKARDMTVLADASLKGILPLARPARQSIRVANAGAAPYTVTVGQRFQDKRGRIYVADAAVTIAGGGNGLVSVTQQTLRVITHTVNLPTTFYSIEVSPGDSGVHVSNVSLWRGGDEFQYRPDWVNVLPGDLAYSLETDERRRLLVRLGSSNVIGVGVQTGEVYEIRVTECEGQISDLAVGDPFTLEYIYTEADGRISATLDSTLDEGADPLSVAELRTMALYPSVYNHDAVFLAEFDFLLRRYLKPLRFLSVWNEQIEEDVRGPDVDNINTLLVSGQVVGMSNGEFESRVRALIAKADNSYKVRFVPLSAQAVPMVVDVSISVVHDIATVQAQVKQTLLEVYGDGASAVARGMSSPLRTRAISDLLKGKVPALKDSLADIRVTMTLPATPLPEHFIHLTEASITVNVERAAFGSGPWSTY